MLVVTIREFQKVYIGEDIVIEVYKANASNQFRLAVEAPDDIRVSRGAVTYKEDRDERRRDMAKERNLRFKKRQAKRVMSEFLKGETKK